MTRDEYFELGKKFYERFKTLHKYVASQYNKAFDIFNLELSMIEDGEDEFFIRLHYNDIMDCIRNSIYVYEVIFEDTEFPDFCEHLVFQLTEEGVVQQEEYKFRLPMQSSLVAKSCRSKMMQEILNDGFMREYGDSWAPINASDIERMKDELALVQPESSLGHSVEVTFTRDQIIQTFEHLSITPLKEKMERINNYLIYRNRAENETLDEAISIHKFLVSLFFQGVLSDAIILAEFCGNLNWLIKTTTVDIHVTKKDTGDNKINMEEVMKFVDQGKTEEERKRIFQKATEWAPREGIDHYKGIS